MSLKVYWLYPNYAQGKKSHPETSGVFQSPNEGLEEHEGSLHLWFWSRKQKSGIQNFIRLWPISKLLSRWKTLARILEDPQNLNSEGHEDFLYLLTQWTKPNSVYERHDTIVSSNFLLNQDLRGHEGS